MKLSGINKAIIEETRFLIEEVKKKRETIGTTGGDWFIHFVLASINIHLSHKKKSPLPIEAIKACKEITESTLQYYHYNDYPDLSNRLRAFCEKMQAMA